ncbi:response regulator [Candidatus Wolfebacteria bacterium]|nr:response regulator [Candidatus Wolfebacteria bacterium]
MKTILIIEDDIYIVRAYTIKLEKENIGAQSAVDGEAGIEFLKKNRLPDLIILDLMLPKKSGFEVLKEIKANNLWKNIPVVILSNLGQEEDIKKGKELGAIDYIIKADTNIEEVIVRVKKHLSP